MSPPENTNGIDPTQPDPGAILTVVPHVLLVAAAILALVLAWRSPRWRASAVFLGSMALASYVGWGCVALLPGWTPGRLPFTGWTRAIFHVSEACRIAPSLLLWGFVQWEMGHPVRPDARELIERSSLRFTYLMSACIFGYPALLRGDPLATVDPLRAYYAFIDAVVVLESSRIAVRWLHARGLRHLLHWSTAPSWVVLMLVAGSGILLPFGSQPLGFWGHVFRVEQAGLIPLWGLVCGILGTTLLRRSAP
jgi:hypothetical protein